MSQAKTTINHDGLRRRAEAREGRPSAARTGQGEGGILRFDFGEKGQKPENIAWGESFRTFEANPIAFLHRDKTADGKPSRFFTFVERDHKKR